MVYNPELVKQLLGEQVAELFDGTIKIEPSKNETIFGNLIAGDKLIFKFKDELKLSVRQFIISGIK
jgi:hypothetical protein